VTEGDDKPIKYPAIFSRADISIITKSDLLPYVPFDLDTVKKHISSLNPDGVILVVSSTSGEGIDLWCDLLASRFEAKQKS
jgi:hydrogenase nickel incorporation protein HypB